MVPVLYLFCEEPDLELTLTLNKTIDHIQYVWHV